MRAARKIRFGVVGAGLWGEVHAEIYSRHPYAELAAVCDADAARARKVAGAYEGVRAYTDFR
jgi:predicted dehydrogenase